MTNEEQRQQICQAVELLANNLLIANSIVLSNLITLGEFDANESKIRSALLPPLALINNGVSALSKVAKELLYYEKKPTGEEPTE